MLSTYRRRRRLCRRCRMAARLRSRRASASTLWVSGELDAATAPALIEALADETIEHVDLSSVTFIDAAGLAALLGARAAYGRRDRVVLRSPSPCVSRLLRLCAVESAFAAQP